MHTNSEEKKNLLLQLASQAFEYDKKLRDQYHIGDKFRFIRDRLELLLQQLNENLSKISSTPTYEKKDLLEGETIIYIYLYNIQGNILHTWQKMFSPAGFYEHSINRPIYAHQKEVEAVIRNKKEKNHHAYLELKIKETSILKKDASKDSMGHPLIKVKEGSLKIDAVLTFFHNEKYYTLTPEGKLIEKNQGQPT